jgi:DNA-binding MarR family transcriptional regulator
VASEASCRELLTRLGDLSVVIKKVRRDLPPGGPRAGLSLLMEVRRRDPLCIGELRGLLGVGPSVVSRHVAGLEARGWVERVPNPQDGRSWYLCVTPAGERAAEEALARAGHLLAVTLDDWTDEELAQLSGLLARLRGSFTADSTADPCRTASEEKGM